jgi:hypothetical protein
LFDDWGNCLRVKEVTLNQLGVKTSSTIIEIKIKLNSKTYNKFVQINIIKLIFEAFIELE